MGAVAILGGSTEGIVPVLLFSVYPVGWYWLKKQPMRAIALPGLSWLLAAAISGDFLLALVLIFSLFPGMILGMLVERRWPLGKSLAVVTALIFLFAAGSYALMWPVVREMWHQVFTQYQEQLAQEPASVGTENTLAAAAWLDTHWVYVCFGLIFGMILLCQLLLVSLLFKRIGREAQLNQYRSAFGQLRMPEPLVWLAILVALGWFWDSYYPNDLLRIVVWNGAIMLAFVYFVNGISIVAFGAALFQLRRPTLVFLVITLVLFNLYQLLPAVGFFDTWIDFRSWFMRIRQRQLKAKEPDL
jgi:hypothetical protein